MERMWSRSLRTTAAAAVVAFVSVMVLSPPVPAEVGNASAGPRTPRRPAVAAKSRPAPTPVSARGARHGASMVVAVDPETGSIGPASPDQMIELGARELNGLLRTTAGLTAVRLADGSMMLDLRGRYREFVVLRLDPVAGPRLGCVHDQRALRRALDPCAPPPAGFEER